MSPQKHTVTQEDLDVNPELVKRGVKVDDEIEASELNNEVKDELSPELADKPAESEEEAE